MESATIALAAVASIGNYAAYEYVSAGSAGVDPALGLSAAAGLGTLLVAYAVTDKS